MDQRKGSMLRALSMVGVGYIGWSKDIRTLSKLAIESFTIGFYAYLSERCLLSSLYTGFFISLK